MKRDGSDVFEDEELVTLGVGVIVISSKLDSPLDELARCFLVRFSPCRGVSFS